MNKNDLEIKNCATAKRQMKKIFIPRELLNSLHQNKGNQQNVKKNGFLGRRITSAVVIRQESTNNKQQPSVIEAPCSNTDENKKFQLPPIRSDYFKEGLRTPFRRRSQSKFYQAKEDKEMSRPCSSFFSKMKSMYRPETYSQIDPRYSVRGILKTSGILNTFGTGKLNSTENQEVFTYLQHSPLTFNQNDSERFTIENGPSSPVPSTIESEQFVSCVMSPKSKDLISPNSHGLTISFNENSEDYLIKSDSYYSSSCSSSSEITKSSSYDEEVLSPVTIFSPTSASSNDQIKAYSGPSKDKINYQYDTVILQKTVEMELVRFMPSRIDYERPTSIESDNDSNQVIENEILNDTEMNRAFSAHRDQFARGASTGLSLIYRRK